MATRLERLRNLVAVQQQLKGFHEMRHAAHLAESHAAGAEAADIMARAEMPDSLSSLFPDVYARGIADALGRQAASAQKAVAEAGRVATETARTNMVERSYRHASLKERRAAEDKERLEALQRRKPVS